MGTPNTTATIVAWKYSTLMLEANWEFVAFNPNPNAFRSLGDGSVLLTKPGDIPTRAKDGIEKGLPLKRGEAEGDATIPSVISALIPNSGDIVRVQFDEPMSVGPSGARGFLLVTSGEPVKVKYLSVSDNNPNILLFDVSRKILKTETGCLISYVQPVGGIQDLDGNDLASFTNLNVQNNSNV